MILLMMVIDMELLSGCACVAVWRERERERERVIGRIIYNAF